MSIHLPPNNGGTERKANQPSHRGQKMGDNMNKTVGLIAATATVFHPDDSVNCDIIPSYAQMLHASGVAGVFVNGTTGEGMSLSLSDRRATAERWVNAAPEGFKVIIHVGHTCQQESYGLALHAARIGAAAVGEIGPVFYRPDTVDALADYVAATASAAPELPYYYYHMPIMNQIKFPMLELLKRIRDVANFAGIKYTFEDLDDYERCIRFADGKYDVLFGRDERLLEAMRRGAHTLAKLSEGAWAPAIEVAALYAYAGMNTQAVEWFERATEGRDPNMPYMNVWPLTPSLRSDAAFLDVLRRVGLPLVEA